MELSIIKAPEKLLMKGFEINERNLFISLLIYWYHCLLIFVFILVFYENQRVWFIISFLIFLVLNKIKGYCLII
jgi:hypothetical protein